MCLAVWTHHAKRRLAKSHVHNNWTWLSNDGCGCSRMRCIRPRLGICLGWWVPSCLLVPTWKKKNTDLQLKNKFKKLHDGSWKQNWCKMYNVSLHQLCWLETMILLVRFKVKHIKYLIFYCVTRLLMKIFQFLLLHEYVIAFNIIITVVSHVNFSNWISVNKLYG